MITPSEDATHLKLLAIFHAIYGALHILLACTPVIFLIPGIYMVLAPDHSTTGSELGSLTVGWIMVVASGVAITIGIIGALLQLLTAWFISQRKCFFFCLLMGFISCISIPFGTLLGVFNIMVLGRSSVKPLFTGEKPTPDLNPAPTPAVIETPPTQEFFPDRLV